MTQSIKRLDILNWEQDGYKPLVFSHDWQVALLNCEPHYTWQNVHQVERHNQTEEVFFLWRGKAALFIASEDGIQVEDMIPGIVYNVLAGQWHNLVSTPDASMLIIENRDTHLNDCEYRPFTPEEQQLLFKKLPDWAK